MIKLNTFCSKTPFEVYKEAVERKTNIATRSELEDIEGSIKSCYEDYNVHFDDNNVEAINPSSICNFHKEELLKLFRSGTKLVKDFRSEFFRINSQTYNNLCPYCAISEANTTEHILPKEQFPEFSINVLNLIPACSLCNSKKGEDFLDGSNERFTINFYTDNIPEVQFLLAEIIQSGSEVIVKYKLENPSETIEPRIYNLISRHYKRFNLLERYNDKAISSLPEIKNDYLAERLADSSAFNIFARKQLEKCSLDEPAYGYNHWHIVLRKAAASSNTFKNYIMNHPLP